MTPWIRLPVLTLFIVGSLFVFAFASSPSVIAIIDFYVEHGVIILSSYTLSILKRTITLTVAVSVCIICNIHASINRLKWNSVKLYGKKDVHTSTLRAHLTRRWIYFRMNHSQSLTSCDTHTRTRIKGEHRDVKHLVSRVLRFTFNCSPAIYQQQLLFAFPMCLCGQFNKHIMAYETNHIN